MLYKFLCFLVRLFYKIFFFGSVTGLENLPKEGGYALCGNHTSNHDAPFVASLIKVRVAFLAKREMCDVPLFGKLVKKLGAVPIDREKRDVAAIKESLRIMKSGMGLMVYPQGTRMKEITPESVKPGILSMAHKAGVPVIPFGIVGKFKLWSRVKVNIGKPITIAEIGEILEIEDRAEMNTKLANLLYVRIKELTEEQ